ncbi:MAG: LPS export ABC transporter permease LptF [Bdellovibrionota bacterium]
MFLSIVKKIPLLRLPWMFYRYILSEVFRPFMGAVVFFLFVLLMFQVIRLSDFFVVHNVSGYSILSLLGYLALTFTPVIVPIAFLLAVLLGFGRLSGDSEVLALRAAGLSVYSMLVPVMAFSVVLAIVTTFCNFYFVPYGSRMFRYELFRISNTKAIATIHPGTFTEGFFDLVLYADQVDSKKNTLQKVLIYDERKKDAAVTVVAHNGEILANLQDKNGIPGLVLRLFNGSLHRSDPQKNIYEKTNFDVYDIFLRIETARVVGVEVPKTMDIGVLRKRIVELRQKMLANEPLSTDEKLDYINFGVEYWKRMALSFSCFIFAIMGVAFGVVRTRTVRSNSFLICLLVLLFYWGVYSVGHNLASDGKIPAFVGMWSANALLLVVAVVMLRRVAR